MSREVQTVVGLHASGSRRRRIEVASPPVYHRIGEVLEEEGIGLQSVADRMRINVTQADQEADPASDLALSALHRWQAALEVPAANLLTRPIPPVAPIIELRASLLTAIRTVRALQLHVDDEQGQSLAISLAQRLTEMIPQLTELSCWHAAGRR